MKFDLIILTAANETQATGYRAQLDWRRANGMIAPETATLVLADPGGRRVGSFGATLNAIRESGIADWDSSRVFICHSGGDGKRTPAYAARGKVFTPVPARDKSSHPLAIFDLILANAEKLPAAPGILVASGDVVLTFGDSDLAMMDFPSSGVFGVGYLDSIAQGSRHGVYVADRGGRVLDFLQKPSEEVARAAGAVDGSNRVAVDTGLVFIAPDLCRTLAGYAAKSGVVEGLASGAIPQMDIYEEFLMALVPSITPERYLARFSKAIGAHPGHRERLEATYAMLHGRGFSCRVAGECDFFHIGSSAELLHGFTGGGLAARLYGFAPEKAFPGAPGAFVFDSSVGGIVGRGASLVEGCIWPGTLRLGGDNIVTGLRADGDGELREVALPEGIGLVAMPVGERDWAAVAYGIADDFKTPFSTAAGARPCLFLNRHVGEWLSARGLAPSTLWQGDEALGMWSARLWRTGPLAQALRDAMAALEPGRADPAFASWKRLSMSELVPLVNHGRCLVQFPNSKSPTPNHR